MTILRNTARKICAAVMAVSFVATGAPNVSASPRHRPTLQTTHANAPGVQHRRDDGRERFERRGNRVYYNGHRGWEQYRRGYRRYNGWWFPPSAFIAGVIIGGAIANHPRRARLSAAHVRWCQNRWRSYRASDNTYQPSRGPRQACVSPYVT